MFRKKLPTIGVMMALLSGVRCDVRLRGSDQVAATPALYSAQQAVDFTGHAISPNYYCINNCVCSDYEVTQDPTNSSLAVFNGGGTSCQCGSTPFYVVIPETINTNQSLTCGFSRTNPYGCHCNAYQRSKWPYIGIHIYCSAGGGANACYGWFSNVRQNKYDDDDDVFQDSGSDLLENEAIDSFFLKHPYLSRPADLLRTDRKPNTQTHHTPTPDALSPVASQPRPHSAPNTSAPNYVSWLISSEPLRERNILPGRSIAPSAPIRSLATKTLVDKPWAIVTNPPHNEDAVYYSDMGGRLIKLTPSAMDAAVLLDLNGTDASIIDSFAFVSPSSVVFSYQNSIRQAGLSSTLSTTSSSVIYSCASSCGNVVLDSAKSTIYFALETPNNATTADIVSLPLATTNASPTPIIRNVNRAKNTIIPLAFDSSQLFFGDWLYGVHVVSTSTASFPINAASNYDAVTPTVVEPDGNVLSISIDATVSPRVLHWITVRGYVSSRSLPDPAAGDGVFLSAPVSRRRLTHSSVNGSDDSEAANGLGLRPPTWHAVAPWRGGIVGTEGGHIYYFNGTGTKSLIYNTWYRNFNSISGSFRTADCQATAIQYNSDSTSVLHVEPIPEFGPSTPTWKKGSVDAEVSVTAMVDSESEGTGYLATKLPSNANAVVQADTKGNTLLKLCSDEGRGVSDAKYDVSSTGQVFYLGSHSYVFGCTVYSWNPTDPSRFNLLRSFESKGSSVAYSEQAETLYVALNPGQEGVIIAMHPNGSSNHTIYNSSVPSNPNYSSATISNLQTDSDSLYWLTQSSKAQTISRAGLDGADIRILLNLGGTSDTTVPPILVSPVSNDIAFIAASFNSRARTIYLLNKDGTDLRQSRLVPFMSPTAIFTPPSGDTVYIHAGDDRVISIKRSDAARDPSGLLTPFDVLINSSLPEYSVITAVSIDFTASKITLARATSSAYPPPLEILSYNLDGSGREVLASRTPDNVQFYKGTLDGESQQGYGVRSTGDPYSPSGYEWSVVRYDFKTNTTTSISQQFNSNSQQSGPIALSPSKKQLLYTTSNNNGFEIWSCVPSNCAASAKLVVSSSLHINQFLDLAVDWASQKLWARPSSGVVSSALFQCDLTSNTTEVIFVNFPTSNSGSNTLSVVSWDAVAKGLMVGTRSDQGIASFYVASAPLPAAGANSTTATTLIRSFQPLDVAIDWNSKSALCQLNWAYLSPGPGPKPTKLLKYDLISHEKSFVTADIPGIPVSSSFDYPRNLRAFNSRLYSNPRPDSALMSTTVTGADPQILIETISARPYRLYYDRPQQRLAWPDVTANQTNVLLYCQVGHAGTGDELLTSGPVPAGFASMAIHDNNMFSVYSNNGSILVTDFETSVTKTLVAPSAPLVNASSIAVDPDNNSLYVATKRGDIFAVNIASGADPTPSLWYSDPNKSPIYQVWVTLGLDHCFTENP